MNRDRIFATLKAGAEDRRGATAVAFAVSLAVLAPMALGVFDIYSRTQQRAKLQDALDAATLYAAKSAASTDAELDAAGEKSLKVNLQLIGGATLLGADFHASGTKVVSAASVKLPAFAPDLYPHEPVVVGSQVERAMDNLEVALVLDNTGSMSGTKIATLITESKKLVDKLELASKRSSDPANAVKIALVPFSFAVRPVDTVTLTNYTPSSHTGPGVPAWIDPQGKAHRTVSATDYDIFKTMTDRLAVMQKLSTSWSGCVESRTYPYDMNDDPPVAGAAASWFTPYFWPDEPDTKGYANDYVADKSGYDANHWKESLQDETKYASGAWKSGTKGNSFSAAVETYKYGPNAGCTMAPVIRLTNDMAKIRTAIDGMKAVGTTNIPEGLVWGWHTLSPNLPFEDGKSYNTKHLRKVIILMTDGQNTFLDAKDSANKNNSDYTGLGFIWQNMLGIKSGSDSDRTSAMNARLTELCTNAKAKKIEIYTILVEDNSAVSTLLQSCATTPDKFYNVQNVATLGVAFDAIAGAITNLRLSH
jgi:Flp pilus assembly protein TadG